MKLCRFTLLLLVISTSVCAGKINWADLRPDIPSIDDPFLSLTDEQLYELGTIARFQNIEALTDEQVLEKRNIVTKLEKEGVDVDYLFSVREKIKEHRRTVATEPNHQVSGKDQEIPGFITPVEFDGIKVTKFFLVPTAGACIHTPPPPANQIVLVDYPQGIELESLYTPVWVKGELLVKRAKADVTYVDGQADIETVYQMTAVNIENYQTP